MYILISGTAPPVLCPILETVTSGLWMKMWFATELDIYCQQFNAAPCTEATCQSNILAGLTLNASDSIQGQTTEIKVIRCKTFDI